MMLLIYTAKVVLCSGLLFGYYLLVLRNKAYHQYNRYYILFSTVLSLVLPLVNINLDVFTFQPNDRFIDTLRVVTIGGWEKEFIVTAHTRFLDSIFTRQNILLCIYLAGSLVFFIPMLRSLLYIRKLARQYEHKQYEGFEFYNTSEPSTPFSFLKSIYWNNDIPVESEHGAYILRHEIFHIRQHHSRDIIWMQCLKVVCWFNPFYHLMKTELQTIHEFLADEHALEGSDQYAYAELLVLRAIRQKQSTMPNHFFHNQIKRRIAMITKTKLYRYNYVGKAMALPVLFIIFCAFTINVNQHSGGKIFQRLLEHDTLSPEEVAGLDGKDVRTINVNEDVVVFKLKNGDSVIMRKNDAKAYAEKVRAEAAQSQDTIYKKVEVEPEYPGGAPGWLAYLNKTFRYPPEAVAKKIEGTVLVQFQIDQQGNVSDIQAIKGPVMGGLREEAVRVFKESGKWIPAKQFGITVKAYKIQPITFKLHE